MRFKEANGGWNAGRLSQAEAANLLGMSERNFRRYLLRYEEAGEAELEDRRLESCVARGAPVDEVLAVQEQYRERHPGWNVQHFHAWYRKAGGTRSSSGVKKHLQAGQLIEHGKKRGTHRQKRERKPLPGMMIHQDGSRHEGLPGQWHDLIVTMDGATGEHYSMFLTEEEGTASSLLGMRDVIETRGLPCSFYSDRGSHYWLTPEAGGKVDKQHLTQFGAAMKRRGIEMIPADSPEARGRSERAFATHQDRRVKELVLAGITGQEEANRYIHQTYLPEFNTQFTVPAREEGTAFVPWIGCDLSEQLCECHERGVGSDNGVKFEKLNLPIPADRHRCHYVKAKVQVHRTPDGRLSIFHGPRKLADYAPAGNEVTPEAALKRAA
jgi:hypothetical protein